uniref:Uncharacterized protein n=1 Tax=Trichuris muris TaxID=70415 RepID=A0A5S6QE42_TRIMR
MGQPNCLCIPEPPTFTISPPPDGVNLFVHHYDHRQDTPTDMLSCPEVVFDPQNVHSSTQISTGHKLFGWVFILLMSMIAVKLITMCVLPTISTLLRQQDKRKGVKVSPPGPWGAKRRYLELDGKTNFRGPPDSPFGGSDWSYYSIRPVSSRQPVKEESTPSDSDGRNRLCLWFKRPFGASSTGGTYDQIPLDPIPGPCPGQFMCDTQYGRHALACSRRTTGDDHYGALSKCRDDPRSAGPQVVSICGFARDDERECLRSLKPVRRVTLVTASHPLLQEYPASDSWSPRYSTFNAATERTFVSREMWL